ncbi:MAG: class I SAM-dependent methyltransferase [Ardenticatenales bacterium]
MTTLPSAPLPSAPLPSATLPRVVLRLDRDKPVRQRHPWIFSGAIDRVEGAPERGAVTDVFDADGAWLARGHFSGASQIRVRIMTWEEAEPLDAEAWRWRLARAVALRARLGLMADPDGACRLVHAESDGLPGLIVDRYGPWLVLQALSAGADTARETIVPLLAEVVAAHVPVRGIYERSTDDVRDKEDLAPVAGPLWGDAPPESVTVREPGVAGPVEYDVDLAGGHKTGAYLDQAANRRTVAGWCAGADVLNAFSYTGGFALHALAAGARHVINVDSSGPALAQAAAAAVRAGWTVDVGREDAMDDEGGAVDVEPAAEPDGAPASPRMTNVEANVFGYLRACRAAGRTFDVVILDPPKFVHHAGQVDKAARAYKDMMFVGLQVLRPGGILAAFSCSGLLTPDLFQKIAFAAATDAQRDAQILLRLEQSGDHPVRLCFPEGAYLKGLLCRVMPERGESD